MFSMFSNVSMFNTFMNGGKAYSAELNREFKNIFFKKKSIQKKIRKHLKLNDFIREVTNNMKKTKSVKCNSVLKQVEQKSLADDQYCKIFDFHCLTRVQNNTER